MSSLTVTTEKPRAPVALRHREALRQHCLDGMPLSIPDNATLIPVADCKAIVAEMDAALASSTADQATAMAAEVLGAYPSAKPDNPDAYLRSIVLAISACPPDLYPDLYRAVTQRASPFPPVAGEIVTEVRDLVAKRRAAKAVAEKHLSEHKRRGTDKPGKRWADMTDEEKAAHDERMARWRAEFCSSSNKIPLSPEETMSADTASRVRAESIANVEERT